MNSIELGDRAFQSSISTVISSIWMIWIDYIIDLSNLKSIKLGEYALQGRFPLSSSLKMESDIDINELMNRSS